MIHKRALCVTVIDFVGEPSMGFGSRMGCAWIDRDKELKMSQTDSVQGDPHQEILPATSEEQFQQTRKAFEKFVGQITPWLIEVGSWIFGGLIGFNLLVLAPLFTIGPVDSAVIVATAGFALALPLNVTGLVLLRLVQDLRHVRFEDELAKAFQEAGFTDGVPVPTPTALEALRERRTGIVLSSSLVLVTLSGLLTLAGMMATLWHVAWWIGVSFGAMVVLSLFIIIRAITSQPPDWPEVMKQERRDREEIVRQAKERDRKNEK